MPSVSTELTHIGFHHLGAAADPSSRSQTWKVVYHLCLSFVIRFFFAYQCMYLKGTIYKVTRLSSRLKLIC